MFRKKEVKNSFVGNRMIAVYNPTSGDSSDLVFRLTSFAKKRGEKSVVVELPCIGIPRISYRLGLTELEQSKTIDQLLIDYDRDMLNGIKQYIYTSDNFDGLLIQPRSKPDVPTIFKLQNEKTLMEIPGYLKSNLVDYHNVFFVLQGQLCNPMTFFSLREADYEVLAIKESIELIWTYSLYKTLKEDYAIDKSSISMYSEIRNQDFKEHKLYYKPSDLFEMWDRKEVNA